MDPFALVEAAAKAGEADESTGSEGSTNHCGAWQCKAHGDSEQHVHAETVDGLAEVADRALYRAEGLGKNQVAVA